MSDMFSCEFIACNHDVMHGSLCGFLTVTQYIINKLTRTSTQPVFKTFVKHNGSSLSEEKMHYSYILLLLTEWMMTLQELVNALYLLLVQLQ